MSRAQRPVHQLPAGEDKTVKTTMMTIGFRCQVVNNNAINLKCAMQKKLIAINCQHYN